MGNGDKVSAKTRKHLRQLLLTAAVGGALITAPQVVKADTHTLEGTQITSQVINTDPDSVVDVVVENGFNVTATGIAVSITGSGEINYHDQDPSPNNISSLNSTESQGLFVYSTGDNGSKPGAVTINTAGTIQGNTDGIAVTNQGSGATSINVTGDITGTNFNGISVSQSGTNLDITTNNVTGGQNGINVTKANHGQTTIIANGTVTGTDANSDGIYTGQLKGSGLTIQANDVSAGSSAIYAQNNGSGATSVTALGDVTAITNFGIFVQNYASNTTTLDITANNVRGGSSGIYAKNMGSGATTITTTGTVTGTANDGIYANNGNSNAIGGVTVITNGDVKGKNNGIEVESAGRGVTSVTANANVTATNGYGISVQNDASSTGLTVTTGANSTIQGGVAGMLVSNNGTNNDALITVGGDVMGTSINSTGIAVGNESSGNLTLLANNANATISGKYAGIDADNYGSGSMSITTKGNVVQNGEDGYGILATNYGADFTINANNVSGDHYGINAVNYGTGNLSITTTGLIEATGVNESNPYYSAAAVAVTNLEDGKDVIVDVNDVTSTYYGISVENDSTGTTSVTAHGNVTGGVDGIDVFASGTDTSVTSTGNVVGATGYAIYADNDDEDATNLTVTVNNASGGSIGIGAYNSGSGFINVTTNGVVEGADAGIDAEMYGSTNNLHPINITINPDSIVRNSSLSTSDLAIYIIANSSGTATIENKGTLIGSVQADIENDTLINTNTWNSTGGTSDFGDGNDTFTNNGNFLASNDTGNATTIINGIETVNSNPGSSIMMQDGHVGDSITFTSNGSINTFVSGGGSGVFNANGGTLYVDTNIATGQSDQLHVDNVSGGTTGVNVNIVAGLGQPTTGDGIPIVIVDGTSSSNAFALDHPLSAGLYSYALNKVGDPTWNLQSTASPAAVAAGVLPILGSRTALSTLSNVHDRQRDEKVLSDNANSQKGIWARTFGQSNKYDANDSNGFGFDSKVWGAQAGIDLLANGDQTGNRKYAGLYVAYASSNGDATQHGDNIASLDLDATTFGAYYTKYSSRNWYLDAVAQYSRLSGISAKSATDDISPSGNSYALSLEVGQQFHPHASIIREVQAQIIDQYTDVNDVALNDGSKLKLSSLNSITGRFGVRLYGNPQSGKKFLPWLRANIWHTFSGDASVSSLGNSFETPIGGTSGELQLGFTKGASSNGGWSIYGSAGYLFNISGAQYSGWEGTLGLRKGL